MRLGIMVIKKEATEIKTLYRMRIAQKRIVGEI